MANVLRLKLQALYGPRLLLSPAPATKILDPTHIFLKCYGGTALLEDSCSSTLHSDIDGYSKGASGGEASARKGDDVEERALKECNVDKLTNSICDKLWAKANMVRGGKDVGTQRDSGFSPESKKVDKSDPFQQVVSTVRSMVLKNKAKAAAGDKAGVPKPGFEEQEKLSDKNLFEAGGDSGKFGGSNGSSKDIQTGDMAGKSFKQKPSQTSFSNQQNSKDRKEVLSFIDSLDDMKPSQTSFSNRQNSKDKKASLSFLDSLDDATPLSSTIAMSEDSFCMQTETSKSKTAQVNGMDNLLSRERKPLQGKDAMSGSALHSSVKSKMPKEAQGRGRSEIRDQVIGKNTQPAGMLGFKAKGSDDAPLTQWQGKSPSFAKEAASPPLSHQDNSNTLTGYIVCVQNLPFSCNPAMIRSAMANYGEVVGFYKRAVRNDFFNVYVEFKTEQFMEAALASRKLQIGTKSFLIARTDRVLSTVVRLCKVSNDTTEKQLLSTCGKFGNIDNIKKRIHGIYDVFYDVKELPNMTRILASLNEVTFNRSAWVAAPAPLVHPAFQNDLLKSQEGQAWHSFQVNQALNRIESGLVGLSVFFDDLKELTALGKELSMR